MYIFTTQCFASRVGGIESLITNLVYSISIKHDVVVFADQHFYIQDQIFDFENQDKFKTFRYGGIKFFRRYKKAKDIKLFIQNKKINAIFADTWKSLELCIDEINKKKIPSICLAHGNELLYHNEDRKKRILQILNRTDKIVANSKYTAGLIQNIGVQENKVHIINPGAKDLRSLKKTNIYNIFGNPVLLTLARLEKRKGHEKVLHSLTKLKKDFPEIQYIIAGEGLEKKKLLKLVKELKIQKLVHFIGNINDQQKKEIFELASLMVMPTSDESLERSIEGFGITYIEAAMFGISSVASNVGGVGDAVIHNQTGILLNLNEDLYTCLKNILEDKNKLQRLSIKAQERAQKEFNWTNVASKYLNIIKTNFY